MSALTCDCDPSVGFTCLECNVEHLLKQKAEMLEDITTLYMNSRANYINEEGKQKYKKIVEKYRLDFRGRTEGVLLC